MPSYLFVARRLFPETIDLLRRHATVEVWEEDTPAPYLTLCEKARDADALFTTVTDRVDADLLAAAPKLRIVANMAVGYNNIDVAAATAHGIYVSNTPGVLTETTADLTFALILSWARQIPRGHAGAIAQQWPVWAAPMQLFGRDVHGATLGIVGLGRIGQAVAYRARGFGMRVIYSSRTRKLEAERETGARWSESLQALLGQSDFVTLHVPLTETTRRMIGARELAWMRPTGLLVNTARGEIVDQDALVAALQAGRLGGAALDVTTPEPLPRGHPLFTLPNVLITPHIGSATAATRLKMAMLTAQNIVDVLQGRPPTHCVNLQAGQHPRWAAHGA